MAYPATEPDGVVLAPLSPAQQRLWIVHRMDPTGPLYNVAHLLRLRGRLDVAVLEHALAEVVRRHDVLRTTFAERGGEPVQVIAPQRLVREILQVRSMEAHPPALREPAALREAAAEAWRRFDLERGPLCRLLLFPLSAEENLLLVVMHHLVSDGWSLNVLFRELSTFYNASLHGRPAHLPELPMQYAGLSGWERERMQGERFREDLAYWKRRLAGIPPVLDLSVGRPRPPVQRFRGERLPLREAGDLLERARSQARALGATSFEFLLAAYAALLGVYCGHEDVVIGVPMAGRTDPRLRPLIGFFVNTVVLRVDLSGDPPFDELVRRASAVAREAREHQDVPFHRLVEELQPERSPSYTPLVQVFFVKHSPQTRADASLLEGIEATELLLPGRESLFDLTLTIDEERSHAEYDADLLDAETVGRLLEHYRAVVEAAVADPRRRCSELLSPGGADREVVLSGRRAAALASRPLRCVHEIFSEQAGRTPDAVALVSRPERLTYARLERRANRLAHLLRRRGVAPEVRVGVCLERSPDLIVSLLAVLKAGGAYVPLDPAYPPERLAFLLADSGAKVLLTRERLRERLPEHGAEVVCVDALPWAEEPETAPESGAGVENLAYLIYTSGSTGTPKGVMIPHGALAGYTEVMREAWGIGPDDRVLQFASASFDASAEEIYCTLLSGACLVLRTEEMLGSVDTFLGTCREWGITVLDLPTAYWHELVAGVAEQGRAQLPPPLRLVIIGGEEASPERLRAWRRHSGGRVRLLNSYGPTETTIVAALCDLTVGAEEEPGAPLRRVPIGRPIPGAGAYVLGGAMQPVPVGVPGELFIGGAGVARGYLDRPALTAERFLPDPFSGEPGARLYRTGDRVRWLPEGTLEFLGRIDQQVKIRGFRIEPGEIEAALRTHPAVREAVVLARGDAPGERRLVGYVVPQGPLSATELREHLRGYLPEYMVPGALVFLGTLPLTPSGKLDRQALPRPDHIEEEAYVAPRTPLEEVLAGIWTDVLGRERIGVHESFLALGGHSLLATRIASRIREACGVELPVRALFETPTVAELARRLEGMGDGGSADAPRITRTSREAHRVKLSALGEAPP